MSASTSATDPGKAEVARKTPRRRSIEELGSSKGVENFRTIPYERRLSIFCKRPEECDEAELLANVWSQVNRHLGTNVGLYPQS